MLALLLFLAAATTDVVVITLPARGDVSVALSPAGRAEMKREGTLSRVKIEAERLQSQGVLGPSFFTHVVWCVSPEGVFDNLGELIVSGERGRLEATTTFEQFGILITAEPHYMVDKPSASIVYRNEAPRDEGIRRFNVPVEVGAHEYGAIQLPPQGAVPRIVSQSRAAFQIAGNAGAERWAQAEFRLARVALETTEEMLKRGTPLEIISPTANETIRRSQRALAMAGERRTLMAMEDLEREVASLSEEKQERSTRVRELTEQLAAANVQVRNLRDELGAATRSRDEITQEKERAETRLRAAERDLTELKRREDELQGRLTLTFRANHFDGKGLTAAGREALVRVAAMAEVIPGPLRLDGFPSEVAFQAVMLYLADAGISQDRIVIRR